MKNMFKNAYFGKPYKTRDGEKAIYLREDFKHHLYLENGGIIDCNRDGTFESVIGRIEKLDIVSEWQEELTDDELAKLINETIKEKDKLSKHYEGLGLYYGYSYVDILKEVLHKLLKNK